MFRARERDGIGKFPIPKKNKYSTERAMRIGEERRKEKLHRERECDE